jgi:single-strand DNA-binding protein
VNNYSVIGRVGKDAVTRQAGSTPVTGFSLAVDSGWGDKKQTIWLDCSLWGARGEKVAEYITKGSQLGATGELGTREHEGKTYLTLKVENVSLIGGKSEGGERSARPQRQESAPQQQAAADDFDDEPLPF